jgi:hypothetical protein
VHENRTNILYRPVSKPLVAVQWMYVSPAINCALVQAVVKARSGLHLQLVGSVREPARHPLLPHFSDRNDLLSRPIDSHMSRGHLVVTCLKRHLRLIVGQVKPPRCASVKPLSCTTKFTDLQAAAVFLATHWSHWITFNDPYQAAARMFTWKC